MRSGLFIEDLAENLLGTRDTTGWPHDALRDERTVDAIRAAFQSDAVLPHVCLKDALHADRAEDLAAALQTAKFTRHHHDAYKISIARRDQQRPSALTEFTDWLLTPEAALHHRALTGWRRELRCVQVQVSRLKVGDFFPPHIDTDELGLSAVYAFTKDWKPQWGGELYFPGEGGKDRVTVPVMFNGLFLFRPKGAAHGVRKLRAGAKGRYRYTVTAFYLER